MNELIKIDESGRTTARGLYEFLELNPAHFARWAATNIVTNQFAEADADYNRFTIYGETPTGGEVEREDYYLTIDFAKKLCMTSKTKRGEQARNYFIEVEKRFKQVPALPIPQTLPAALRAYADEVEKNEVLQLKTAQQSQVINELKPKADYTDLILKSKGLVTITQIAKDYGMSGQEMNKVLHDFKVQYKQSNQWLLYADIQDKGYTHSETIDFKRKDGTPDVTMNTKWTQKGRLYLYNLLKKNGILPLIEKEET